MKKVLLLNPPGRGPYIRDNYCSYSAKANYFWEPIDLLVQSAWLRDKAELQVLDAIALDLQPDEVIRQIEQDKPDAIISLSGSVSLDEDRKLFERIKAVDRSIDITITGDLCLSGAADALTKMPAVDAALADYTTPGFVDYLEDVRKKAGKQYVSLAYRDGDDIVAELPAESKEMDYPVPAHDLFPISRYRISTSIERKFATCIASLGCNFKCPFCICSVMDLRLRKIDSLLAELRAIRDLGIREVYFYDPNFTVNKNRCIQMLDAIIAEDLGLIFSCNSHITVSEQVLDRLAQAGCHTIMFGIENANVELLKRYSKGITHQRIKSTLEACAKRKIRTFGYFLIGLPGETESTILDTINFATELPLSYASFNFPSPVEGTELHREAKEKGLLADSEQNLDRSSEVSIKLPGLTRKRLIQLKRSAYWRFYLRPFFLLRTLRILYPRKKWGLFIKDVWTFLSRNFI